MKNKTKPSDFWGLNFFSENKKISNFFDKYLKFFSKCKRWIIENLQII